MNDKFLEEVWHEQLKQFPLQEKVDFASCVNSLKELSENLPQNHLRFESKKPIASKKPIVVLCIDEARVLLQTPENNVSIFRDLRRALLNQGKLNLPVHFVVVLIDTFSRVSNFTPTVENDSPSMRTSSIDIQLFPPYYFLGTTDTYSKHDGDNIIDKDAPIQGLLSFYSLSGYGRPLWRSHWQSFQLNDKDLEEEIIELAKCKLLMKKEDNYLEHYLPSRSSDRNSLKLHQHGFIASVGARVPLRFYDTSLASELVGAHMATCQKISEDRDLIYANYPSEPILAEGAAVIWNEMENPLYIIFRGLYYHERVNALSLGDRGELVAQIMLLHAIDNAIQYKINKEPGKEKSRKEYFGRQPVEKLIPVFDFIKSLVSHHDLKNKLEKLEKDEEANTDEVLKNGYVCFNHFVRLFSPLTQKTVEELGKRCAAAVMPNGHKGVDLVLVVFFKKENIEEVDPPGGIIVVQVKNRSKDSHFLKKVKEKIKPSHLWDDYDDKASMEYLLNLPTLGIFLSLRGKMEFSFNFLKYSCGGGNLKENSNQSPPDITKIESERRMLLLNVRGDCNMDQSTFRNLLLEGEEIIVDVSKEQLDSSWPVDHPIAVRKKIVNVCACRTTTCSDRCSCIKAKTKCGELCHRNSRKEFKCGNQS